MAETPRSTARSAAVTVLGALLAAYLPCTWVLVSDATVIKDDRLFCFAEMPIVLTQLPLELAGWTNAPESKGSVATIAIAALTALAYWWHRGGIWSRATIFCIFLGWCFLSFFMFAWCTHGHS
jgi:hypothetical protein